jgi:hypothetical protein
MLRLISAPATYTECDEADFDMMQTQVTDYCCCSKIVAQDGFRLKTVSSFNSSRDALSSSRDWPYPDRHLATARLSINFFMPPQLK